MPKAFPVTVALAAAFLIGGRAEGRPAAIVVHPSSEAAVVGQYHMHPVEPGETLHDIARKYDLGITVLQAYYADLNPWLLEAGGILPIPALWIVPTVKKRGIVINVPEMRLYYFLPKSDTVLTYPVTVGEKITPTPIGTFSVVGKEVDPYWNIPARLQYKYDVTSMPPGDDNPIGKYWLALSRQSYGIHGTDNPWSVGRIISNGCIRLYPEDMEKLYPLVPEGTAVSIIYQPVKFGFGEGEIFIEVHEDYYGRVGDLERHARAIAKKMGIEDAVEWERVQAALKEKSGVPVSVGGLLEGG